MELAYAVYSSTYIMEPAYVVYSCTYSTYSMEPAYAVYSIGSVLMTDVGGAWYSH